MESFFANTFLFGEDILNSIHIFAGSWLDMAMLVITSAGSETFYMIALPILYWCWDRRRAIYVGAVFLVAMTVNDALKYLFNNPRPDPEKLIHGIRELAVQYKPGGPGFPSGHAQGSTAFWGTIAVMAGTKAVRIACPAMIILVTYSRLHLGVHYMGDVIGGLVLGVLCLAVILPAAMAAGKYYRMVSPILITIVLLIFPIGIYLTVPGQYINTTMGTISGFLIGALLTDDRIRFNPRNRLPYQFAKIVIGIAVVAAIRFGLKFILPNSLEAGFFRYWCIGFWCSFGAPYLFGKIAVLRGEDGDLL
ncbi:MAG TPA: phosphatase PAP2 family protein [Spirochaetota bacterium]|nr:phosphatase PAP2 family protein [Spirochaetota bacterium]HPC42807.1 phosphatase PAP2 family protein [Spirochaetota bacterium]HPL15957.1 phosphatase PAP2 family protein [Spirochaetota bacterium]HQF08990.1 phosphatase PAP2 family protein [Spirochaetota bacterium]HQH97878.1 phosphatase PAP2 family protein [Spirochaetota bacterium]